MNKLVYNLYIKNSYFYLTKLTYYLFNIVTKP